MRLDPETCPPCMITKPMQTIDQGYGIYPTPTDTCGPVPKPPVGQFPNFGAQCSLCCPPSYAQRRRLILETSDDPMPWSNIPYAVKSELEDDCGCLRKMGPSCASTPSGGQGRRVSVATALQSGFAGSRFAPDLSPMDTQGQPIRQGANLT